jgi:hypothetical protein
MPKRLTECKITDGNVVKTDNTKTVEGKHANASYTCGTPNCLVKVRGPLGTLVEILDVLPTSLVNIIFRLAYGGNENPCALISGVEICKSRRTRCVRCADCVETLVMNEVRNGNMVNNYNNDAIGVSIRCDLSTCKKKSYAVILF